MKRAIALILVALAAGCASAPSNDRQAAECAQIAEDLAQAERARRVGLEKRKAAWKGVIPVVVAALYVSADSEVTEAEQRIADRQAEIASRGCT